MSAGKGDTPRPVSGDKFRENYDRIFRKRPTCKCGGTVLKWGPATYVCDRVVFALGTIADNSPCDNAMMGG